MLINGIFYQSFLGLPLYQIDPMTLFIYLVIFSSFNIAVLFGWNYLFKFIIK